MDLNSVNITATQVAKNYFSAYVENGFIYSYSVYGERQQVGVTNDAYTALQKTAQEALDKAEKYYQRLVELGDIVPPKTSEETIAELMSVVLENRVYSDAKFNALERQNEAMFGVLKSEIADLSCNVPKRPPYYAQGFVACGSPIPNGCCN